VDAAGEHADDGSNSEGLDMADAQFAWDDLGQYKSEGRFLDGYPWWDNTDDLIGSYQGALGSRTGTPTTPGTACCSMRPGTAGR
jgi:hypothetical protein